MIKSKLSLLAALASLAISANGAAQSNLDVIELKVDMSEATYLGAKTPENFAGYISALENLVVAQCGPEIGIDPAYNGDPKGEPCKKSLAKLLELDGWNPTALCARDGFRRRTCTETSMNQRYGTYDPAGLTWISEDRRFSGRISGFDTEAVLAQKTNIKRINELRGKLFGFSSWLHNGKKDAKIGADMLKAIEEGMRLTCGYTKTVLLPAATPTGSNAPTTDEGGPVGMGDPSDEKPAGSTSSTSPMADVLNRLNAALPSPTATPEPLPLKGTQYQHIRLLTPECSEFIAKAFSADPMWATPVCYKEGFFTPNCVTARARKRPKPLAGSARSSGPTSGFQSF